MRELFFVGLAMLQPRPGNECPCCSSTVFVMYDSKRQETWLTLAPVVRVDRPESTDETGGNTELMLTTATYYLILSCPDSVIEKWLDVYELNFWLFSFPLLFLSLV